MRKLLLIVLIGIAGLLKAQDPQFTQFYANPLYLNPAFTGANVCLRASTNYRMQWPSIPGKFTTYSLSLDQSVPSLNSGVGLLLLNDKAGSGSLRTTSIGFLYAYQLTINKNWAMRMGIKASENIRAINYNDLIFGDQLARGNASTSIQLPPLDKVNYFDFSTGLLLFSSKYWGGFALDHLTRPNQSLVYGESFLPLKYSFHGGAKIPVRYTQGGKQISISPAINYRGQDKFDQMDVGFYYNDFPLVAGIWYRGIPLFKAYKTGYMNNDGLAFMLGLIYDELKIGYSYDLTVSRLFGSTGGAHELSLSYQFCSMKTLTMKKKKKYSAIPCPTF